MGTSVAGATDTTLDRSENLVINKSYCCMKPREKCSGRECKSPQVHHKHIAVCIRKTDHLGVSMFSQVILQYAFDGPA